VSATVEHLRWLAGGDTGMSSATIWMVMTGETPGRYGRLYPSVPLDADDVGRCVRLLDRFPEWRGRLEEMGDAYPEWLPVVGLWLTIESHYRHGDWSAVNKLLRDAERSARLCPCESEPEPGPWHSRSCRWWRERGT
jgi:hypothetical protein